MNDLVEQHLVRHNSINNDKQEQVSDNVNSSCDPTRRNTKSNHSESAIYLSNSNALTVNKNDIHPIIDLLTREVMRSSTLAEHIEIDHKSQSIIMKFREMPRIDKVFFSFFTNVDNFIKENQNFQLKNYNYKHSEIEYIYEKKEKHQPRKIRSLSCSVVTDKKTGNDSILINWKKL